MIRVIGLKTSVLSRKVHNNRKPTTQKTVISGENKRFIVSLGQQQRPPRAVPTSTRFQQPVSRNLGYCPIINVLPVFGFTDPTKTACIPAFLIRSKVASASSGATEIRRPPEV